MSAFGLDVVLPLPTDQVNVSAFGLDVVLPLITSSVFSASTHADAVFLGTSEAKSRVIGTMVGVDGTALGFIRYGLGIRLTEDGFLPVYFGRDYNLLREEKYALLRAAEEASKMPDAIDGLVHAGWVARIGASLLERRIDFSLGVSRPLSDYEGSLVGVPYAQLSGLEVEGRIGIRNLGFKGFAFDLDYHKRQLDDLNDIFNPQHLTLGAILTYQVGRMAVAFSYRGHYEPAIEGFSGAPSLEGSIRLF